MDNTQKSTTVTTLTPPSAARSGSQVTRANSRWGFGSKEEQIISAVELENYATKTGWLFKRGGGKKSKAWKRRWFILTSQTLYYYKSEKERRPQGQIEPLKEFTVVDDPEDEERRPGQYPFQLRPKSPGGRAYNIYATTEQDKGDWIEVLQQASLGASASKKSVVEIEEKLRRNCYSIPAADLEWSSNANAILGKGASGIVKKGLWLKTTEVAVKALNNLPEFTDEEEMLGFYKEIETLSQLRHPNIVPMFGYCKKDGYICLVTEFVKGGNLSDAIYESEAPMDLFLKLELCMSICRGMVYLHNKRVIHRDLKPGNILIESIEEAKVKVCDFGLSTITQNQSNGETVTKTFGSPAYAAPELPTDTHTEKVDVFSFAVIMWEIYTREKPWNHVSHAWQISDRIQQGERMQIPADCPLSSLITKCWALEPENRPSFSEIYNELETIKSISNTFMNSAIMTTSPAMKSRFSHHPSSSSAASASAYPQTRPISGPLSMSAPSLSTTTTTTAHHHPVITSSSLYSLDDAPIVEMPSPIPAFETPEQRILRGFGTKNALPWNQFSSILQATAKIDAESAEKLKYCLIEKDEVFISTWQTFISWFSPLVVGDEYYQTNSSMPAPVHSANGYRIEEIIDIAGSPWFFGNISAVKAKEILIKRGHGSFLIRFSSNPGCYAISVNYGQVGHWRINAEKLGPTAPIFKIDGRVYRSLHHIIESHSLGGEPLVVKGGMPSTCFLREPVSREEMNRPPETLYEAFS